MANVEIEISSRRYLVSCRQGEEDRLRAVASIVDRKAQDATTALGTLSETRQLLIAALLLADELKDRREGANPPTEADPDPAMAEALERLADRVESLAQRLEAGAHVS